MQDAAEGWTPHSFHPSQGLSETPELVHTYSLVDPWHQPHHRLSLGGNAEDPVHGSKHNMSHAPAAAGQQPAPSETDANVAQHPEKVYVVLECAMGQVTASLYVGALPDPRGADPSTPPMAFVAIDIEEVYDLLYEEVRDPAKGWGVLMDDVKVVLEPNRFSENAGRCALPHGKVTWPVFVRTVLYMLNR